MTELASRAVRRDAAHNRERLLAAAREVFIREGHDVALEEVARVAGVSRATLYRNFTSREELVAVVAAEGLDEIETRATALRDQPGGALALVGFVLSQQLTQPSVTSFLLRSDPHFAAVAERTAEAFRSLVEQAEHAGTLRAGVGLVDVLLALQMAEAALREADQAERVERHARAGRLLVRGLFTDEAVAVFAHHLPGIQVEVGRHG